ncbi:uncharacterized protein BO95DRAFT_434872 [Aspergillus brunneoviolaceus CBS 621.78]|uniref:Uncharacterized protein n=1 Tax=Aspergillus brunneoviolaceus CBS 621.78 TaxID=1450534 RepID=A0ACD1FZI0_9EURO|nr:hypothetical protein BO95DRAFT_434872 [Aspergillus brunneoviolaceus CBS 621.78]RAH42385.1 hypothetical protein BO95DRAFT_434872 [Aspergillus brunneoviolaceus CBS 621.78]
MCRPTEKPLLLSVHQNTCYTSRFTIAASDNLSECARMAFAFTCLTEGGGRKKGKASGSCWHRELVNLAVSALVGLPRLSTLNREATQSLNQLVVAGKALYVPGCKRHSGLGSVVSKANQSVSKKQECKGFAPWGRENKSANEENRSIANRPGTKNPVAQDRENQDVPPCDTHERGRGRGRVRAPSSGKDQHETPYTTITGVALPCIRDKAPRMAFPASDAARVEKSGVDYRRP